MKRWVAVFVVVAVLGSPPAAVAKAAPGAPIDHWSPPVGGTVVHAFRPAVNPYGAGGHAGIDYEAVPGTAVRAAGRGVVAFTGRVAGAVFVVIAHGHDLRTTYAPMRSVHVRRGREVERGDVLGTAAGTGMRSHEDGLLHFGLRRGELALDPQGLFDTRDLTEVVRLVPADDLGTVASGSLQGERSRISRWVRGATSSIGSFLGSGGFAPPAPAPEALLGTVRLAQGLADWATQGACTSEAGADAFRVDTGRHLVAVAGLNSSWAPGDGAPFQLPVSDLGYEPNEVTTFSYAPDGGAYEAADTHAGPRVAAARLAARLAEYAREHPGESVDLIGHSQGGVVVETFLKLHYRGHADEYPPIGAVVTLAAPHGGAPLASTARRLTADPLARRLTDLATGLSETIPDVTSGSVSDLDPSGPFVADLVRTPLPDDVRLTTIAGVDDVLVPTTRTKLDGADHVVVNPPGWNDHKAILVDRRAVAATGLALAGAPPLCQGMTDLIRARAQPHLIERLTP